MMMNRFLFAAMIAIYSSVSPALAEETPTSLGKFEDWEAFTYKAKDSRVCYVFSVPAKSEAGKKVKRDPIYFMVTHWPGKKVKGQISTIIGYPFKDSSTVKLAVDAQEFELYTNGDMAWADRVEIEQAIVKAMKNGKVLTIAGTSVRGTETKDTYSLAGVIAAMDKIDTTCK